MRLLPLQIAILAGIAIGQYYALQAIVSVANTLQERFR